MPLLQRGRARESAEGRSPFAPAIVEPLCFNGAALVRARKGPASERASAVAGSGFNGAALVRARKVGSRYCPPDAHPLLQRGRARESAEGTVHSGDRTVGVKLQRGRARESAEGYRRNQRTPVCPLCFNGAALVRARKALSSASLFPLSFNSLQRGRARESAEGKFVSIHAASLAYASTGPRS